MAGDPKVDVFDRDAREHGGYLYTLNNRLSCRMATQRTTDIILQAVRFAGRSVLDMACGDGFYTIRFWDQGKPRSMVGVDAAAGAIEIAHANKQHRPLQFVVGDVNKLPWPDNSFDLVLMQSILHHHDAPPAVIAEAFRLAPQILVHEPNGYNPGLKIIEKVSPYHREHREKSYTSRRLERWIEAGGGRVVYRKFAGFVPMFCPDWLAKTMKALEPLIERLPLINAGACAVVVLIAERMDSR